MHPTSAAERQEMIRSTVSGSRYSLTSQKSDTSMNSTGSRQATPKKPLPATPSGGRIDMFTTQTIRSSASAPQPSPQQHKSASPQRPAAPATRSAMLVKFISVFFARLLKTCAYAGCMFMSSTLVFDNRFHNKIKLINDDSNIIY